MAEEKIKSCPICVNESRVLVTKGIIDYCQCCNCGTIFSEALDNDNLVGGEFEEERNEKENHLRIERVNEMTLGMSKEDVWILDFGCGHGRFIEDLKKAGYPNVDGYDAYYEPYSRLPEKNKYHVVTAIEVFEHFSQPYLEIDVINRSLMRGGVVMVETGYVDAAIEDGHDLKTYFYINPQAGHSTIYSHHGIDLLMSYRGFSVKPMFNKHVKLFQKI